VARAKARPFAARMLRHLWTSCSLPLCRLRSRGIGCVTLAARACAISSTVLWPCGLPVENLAPTVRLLTLQQATPTC